MNLYNFICESNRIENIHRDPTAHEINLHEKFLDLHVVQVGDLASFTKHICNVGHSTRWLREKPGMNVRVGDHIAPAGGANIRNRLEDILADIHGGKILPYEAHCLYETLHPFMDGNGRSGRALWLWHMHQIYDGDDLKAIYNRGFLHSWYYESLSASR